MLRHLIYGLLALVALCAAAQVLPPGDYVVLGPPQVMIDYKNGSLAITVVEEQLEVMDNGIQAVWSTRMQYYTPQTGTVQALVTLSLVASIAPSGNLLLAVEACVQNDLETQFTADLCNLFLTSQGCVGNEFVYSQGDLGDYPNNTAIAIQNMCGVSSVIIFGCLGEGVCQGALPGFGPALPAGDYSLYGPASNFDFPGNINPLLNGVSVSIEGNNHILELQLDMYVVQPEPLQGNVTLIGYAFNAPSGQTLFGFTGCSDSGITGMCTSLFTACSAVFTVSQVDLDPGNDTLNETLLIFAKGFCDIQGATQTLCLDGDCELPLSAAVSSTLGFTAGNCLQLDGTVLNVVGGCTLDSLTVNQLTATNLTAGTIDTDILNANYFTVDNAAIGIAFIGEATIVDLTATNLTAGTTNTNILNANLATIDTAAIGIAAIGVANITEASIGPIYSPTFLGGTTALFYGISTFTITFQFISTYTAGLGGVPVLCGATGGAVYSVQLQRMGLFVMGYMTIVSSVVNGGLSNCNFFGAVSGQLDDNFTPSNFFGGGSVTPFIQDQNGNGCYCSLYLGVTPGGYMFFGATKSTADDSCCTGASSLGFANAGTFVVNNAVPDTTSTQFWYMLNPPP